MYLTGVHGQPRPILGGNVRRNRQNLVPRNLLHLQLGRKQPILVSNRANIPKFGTLFGCLNRLTTSSQKKNRGRVPTPPKRGRLLVQCAEVLEDRTRSEDKYGIVALEV